MRSHYLVKVPICSKDYCNRIRPLYWHDHSTFYKIKYDPLFFFSLSMSTCIKFDSYSVTLPVFLLTLSL